MKNNYLYRAKRKWKKLRLRPIRVYCFHQVSDIFDAGSMSAGDWMQTNRFKQAIDTIRKDGYQFISLPEMEKKLKNDVIRIRKYAVLTADDGWASLKNILPWLNQQQIPITLFINPAYLDGKHFRERSTEKYLSDDEIRHFSKQYPLLTIGMHGWEHSDATQQTEQEFTNNIAKSVEYLSSFDNYVPYYAYAWGGHTQSSDMILREMHIFPE